MLPLIAILLTMGCATRLPVRSEQGLAKRIGEIGTVEGIYRTDSNGPWVETDWGHVPVQAANPPLKLDPGVYVWASGKVDRGRLLNGLFVPDVADFRGMRMSHDLVLRNAKIQRHAPSTQPTTMPSMGRP